MFYLNSEWSKQETIQGFGLHVDNLNPIQRRILKEHDLLPGDPKSLEMPALVYLIEGSWEKPADPETGAMSGLVVLKREFVLSASEVVHRAHLRDCGLSAQTAILCLAAVGLEIMLPNVSFNLVADEEIERIKEDLKEERHQYLDAVSTLAQQTYERLKDGDHKDLLRWAESEAAFNLGKV
ncbi:hypothetical protein ABWH93_04300 [Seohaeicola saemankumensis]|uniref:hypothetical protein n=1 Tax=Seohaeicola TaxID=481178 RepID=UPI0035CFB35E